MAGYIPAIRFYLYLIKSLPTPIPFKDAFEEEKTGSASLLRDAISLTEVWNFFAIPKSVSESSG
jgi:hypothetical protein